MSSTDPSVPLEPAEKGSTSSPEEDGNPGPTSPLHNKSQAGVALGADGPKPTASAAAGSSPHGDQPIEQRPAPVFSSTYGQVDLSQDGFDTKAKVSSDGRLNIKIDQRTRRFSDLLVPTLKSQLAAGHSHTEASTNIPPSLTGLDGVRPPKLNVVIHVVGSRGDVQPFIALGKVLKEDYGHRVRLATHSTFRNFVEENGLEFFDIGGDPAELMAFMVKNPGLMPGMDSLKSGDVGKRRKGMHEIVQGCWRSCFEIGDGTNNEPSGDAFSTRTSSDGPVSGRANASSKPFVADAIIANPPSFAHIHCAEKLGIPLHLMFTMPWSATQAFPHPLANIQSSNADASLTNFVSYVLVEMMTWQGLGDIINRFRERTLGLEPMGLMWAPGLTGRLRIPYTYCWSPALIPKPKDWGSHISISGFYFLSLASAFSPPSDLEAFLDQGPPPVYIGFGSIVVDDPNGMTKLILEAVEKTGQRALVSKGWGGFGADSLDIPKGVFMLGNVPHDWLFKRVSCVVHHGGAGTTAAGIALGKPTVVVPFFGDQPFWGAMIARAGAGPKPIPSKQLSSDNLAAAITEALKPETLLRAQQLGHMIGSETGTLNGAQSFHNNLDLDSLTCSVAPSRNAVWRIKRTKIRLSAFSATTLINEGLLDVNDLKLYRPREYESESGPLEPISGGASAVLGTTCSMMMGIADFPVEILRAMRIKPAEKLDAIPSTPTTASKSPTASSVSLEPESLSQTTPGSERVVQSPLETEMSNTFSEGPYDLGEKLSATQSDSSQRGRHSMADALRGSLSRSRSRSQAGGKHLGTNDAQAASHQEGEVGKKITIDAAVEAGRGIGRIVSAGAKSPMDLTLGIARGFHNAPKLYGDESVRQADKVTGLQSGLKAAGKGFGYGFYDGITGLVTQPILGARKEGVAGFVKGFGKGIGGVVLKPGAAIWALPGFTFQGIYKEMQKCYGSSVQNYILAARTTQGFQEWNLSTAEERQDVVQNWKTIQPELRKQRDRYRINLGNSTRHHRTGKGNSHGGGEDALDHGSNGSSSIRKEGMHTKAFVSRKSSSVSHDQHSQDSPNRQSPGALEDSESEQPAMGEPTIDQLSPPTYQNASAASSEEDVKAATRRATELSLKAHMTASPSDPMIDISKEEERQLEEAIKQSLQTNANDLSLSTNPDSKDTQIIDGRRAGSDEALHGALDHDPDTELERALELSKLAHDKHAKELEASQAEEQVVLNYVQRQSALEEQHRSNLLSRDKNDKTE